MSSGEASAPPRSCGEMSSSTGEVCAQSTANGRSRPWSPLPLTRARARWSGAGTLHISAPALLYLVQNNLLYIATSNLEAAVCQVGSPTRAAGTGPSQPLSVSRVHVHA